MTTPSDSEKTQESPRVGLAVASLVLGIVSVAYSLFLIGGVLAICGLVLGWAHLKKRATFRATAIWGIVLSFAGLLFSVGLAVFYSYAYQKAIPSQRSRSEEGLAALKQWQGVEAPDFSMTTLDGGELRLADLRGKRVVLDFWATWCAPCRMEIPHLNRLSSRAEEKDLAIVGISDEDKETVVKFLRKTDVHYPIALAKTQDLPSPYKDIRGLPTTFFLDRNGVIRTVFQGYHSYEALELAALPEDFGGPVERGSPDRERGAAPDSGR